ncbi:predicted protein [Uncinocarpus reesii 1704]|uniref:Uncharacterized protein n=1 Tax=Uncinocarpus reesii (strain UAMH 1704) TaxID=336963 RepID=C4JD84_UNCRE|nr:uncharacterized protein UREG_00294 [Uncinocarpus reesii 1704]EEP75448.1 predicted protein [Uncinocarpus reesii 1704]
MALHRWAVAIVISVLHGHTLAYPRAVTVPPSPTGASCTLHEDHWDCTSFCTTTSSWSGIATTVTDFGAFKSSLDAEYSTGPFSGNKVPVHTTAFSFPGAGLITAYGYYDSNALKSAGYEIISGVTSITGLCEPTATLPPSPTGSSCHPHGDHWHCEPLPSASTEPSSPVATCEPHGDHWHCPPGVPEPTTPPPVETSHPATTGTCEPHGDPLALPTRCS